MASAKSGKGAGNTAPVSSQDNDVTLDVIEHLQGIDSAHVTIMTDAGSVVTVPKFLPTGLPSIDSMLGGGIPAGRFTELFSRGEGQGKSSLAARLMYQMQKAGGTVILMDTEHGFTEKRLKEFGVNPSRVVWVEPAHIEGACATISSTIRYLKRHPEKSDKVLIVWDSLTATPSKNEVEADYGDVLMASAARSYSVNLKKLKDEVAKSEVYCVMINQTRTNIGQQFGPAQSSTGGMAIRYYAGCRLVLYRAAGSWIKDGPTRLGFTVTMEMEKSRLNAPFQRASVPLYFSGGFDAWKSLFDLLVALEEIKPNAAWYKIEGVDKKFQQKKFPEVFQAMPDAVKKRMRVALNAAFVADSVIDEFFE